MGIVYVIRNRKTHHECIESYVVCYDSGGIFPHTVNCGGCGKSVRKAHDADAALAAWKASQYRAREAQA